MNKQDAIRAANLERKAKAEKEFTIEVSRIVNEIGRCNHEIYLNSKSDAKYRKEVSVWEKQLSEMEYQEPEDIIIDL